MKIDPEILESLSLSTKSKGYVDAVIKLLEGQRLIEEARIELGHLDGTINGSFRLVAVPVANRVSATPAPERKDEQKEGKNARGNMRGNKPNAELYKRAYAALLGGPKRANQIAMEIGASENYVRKLFNRPVSGVERTSIEGKRAYKIAGSTLPVAPNAAAPASPPSLPALTTRGGKRKKVWHASDAARAEALLALIKKHDGWASDTRLVREAGLRKGSTFERAVKLLTDQKSIKRMKRKGGPFATAPQVRDTEFQYWVAV